MLNFKTIIVGTDFSDLAAQGVETAIRMAERFEAERVHIVHVVDQGAVDASITPVLPVESFENARHHAVVAGERHLDALAVPDTTIPITREARLGIPAQELADVVEKQGADLVVVASHGRGPVGRLFLGSVASSVIRVVHVPVLVVRGDSAAMQRFDDVLAAVDLSPMSERILAHAFGVAERVNGRVRVISMYERPLVGSYAHEVLPHYVAPEEMDALGERHAKAVETYVKKAAPDTVEYTIEALAKSPPSAVIVEVAELTQANLVVIGASGRNTWNRLLLGSTASHVLAKSPCPVLVVPH